MRKSLVSLLALAAFSVHFEAYAVNSSHGTEQYFQFIQSNPKALKVFLYRMPKGGDLHNHLAGASMAESMIKYGRGDNLCINTQTFAVYVDDKCAPEQSLDNVKPGWQLYEDLLDKWSMRYVLPNESGHDHFFATFDKFGAISAKHSGEMLAEVVNRAGMQNESYLELMETLDGNASGKLGARIGWDNDLDKLRTKLLQNGLPEIVAAMSKKLDTDEATLNNTLACSATKPKAGCDVKVRYLYQVLREQNPENVFAQLLAGFEAANNDKRIVGINMVQAEDGKISMRDYSLHMQMVAYLRQKYPNVKVSLHAGELAPGLVPAEGLRTHINEAVNVAHADRIGHGVDIYSEQDNSADLLSKMAKNHVLVEINLSSNAEILNVSGPTHPIGLYINYGVPVALSTDDEGVSRSNLSEQFIQAEEANHFSYTTVKNMVRNSITYSFMPGENLWNDAEYNSVNTACAKDNIGAKTVSASCQAFLNASEKASMQWKLEGQFVRFEQQYKN